MTAQGVYSRTAVKYRNNVMVGGLQPASRRQLTAEGRPTPANQRQLNKLLLYYFRASYGFDLAKYGIKMQGRRHAQT